MNFEFKIHSLHKNFHEALCFLFILGPLKKHIEVKFTVLGNVVVKLWRDILQSERHALTYQISSDWIPNSRYLLHISNSFKKRMIEEILPLDSVRLFEGYHVFDELKELRWDFDRRIVVHRYTLTKQLLFV